MTEEEIQLNINILLIYVLTIRNVVRGIIANMLITRLNNFIMNKGIKVNSAIFIIIISKNVSIKIFVAMPTMKAKLA